MTTTVLRIDLINDINLTVNHGYNMSQPLYDYQTSQSLMNTFEYSDFTMIDELYIIAKATSSN